MLTTDTHPADSFRKWIVLGAFLLVTGLILANSSLPIFALGLPLMALGIAAPLIVAFSRHKAIRQERERAARGQSTTNPGGVYELHSWKYASARDDDPRRRTEDRLRKTS